MSEGASIYPLTQESLKDLIEGNIHAVNDETKYLVSELIKAKEFVTQNLPKLQELKNQASALAKEIEFMDYRFKTLQTDLRNIWPLNSIPSTEVHRVSKINS